MSNRFVTIWFRYLVTDWLVLRRPQLKELPFVFAEPVHGRLVITAANRVASSQGIQPGMVAADARAVIPGLQVFDEKPGLAGKLLTALALWCIRYTPFAAVYAPDGLVLNSTGCAHLWGGEKKYLDDIIKRLAANGYHVRAAIADTVGAAWAVTHFGKQATIIPPGEQYNALLPLPAQALRLSSIITEKLVKLGLGRVSNFIQMPRAALRRRFGQELIDQLEKATGVQQEIFDPVQAVPVYEERLPSLEPIVTAAGIEMALKSLLDKLCTRLRNIEMGIRMAAFSCYRVDGKTERVQIGTNRPSANSIHLYRLFEEKIQTIEPDLGIEVFVLEAVKVESISPAQEKLWEQSCGTKDTGLAELLDRVANRIGAAAIRRYLPDEHYWPERSFRLATSLDESASIPWQTARPRPTQLLHTPEPIHVAAPIPDYPPMLFRYKGVVHTIVKADGPERIEREWWIEEGMHRDYYCVEDQNGQRYWLFRSGHYTADKPAAWFLHGFFA